MDWVAESIKMQLKEFKLHNTLRIQDLNYHIMAQGFTPVHNDLFKILTEDVVNNGFIDLWTHEDRIPSGKIKLSLNDANKEFTINQYIRIVLNKVGWTHAFIYGIYLNPSDEIIVELVYE